MKIRVYYDDTDAGGVVYHSNYLKFCERTRSELFFAEGKSPCIDGGHFVVKHIDAEFIKSAKLGDLLDVQTAMIGLKNASLHVKHEIYLEKEKLFEMTAQLVFVKEGKITKINTATKAFFTQILV